MCKLIKEKPHLFFMCKSHSCVKLHALPAPAPASRRALGGWAQTEHPADGRDLTVRKYSLGSLLPFSTHSSGHTAIKGYDCSFCHPVFS